MTAEIFHPEFKRPEHAPSPEEAHSLNAQAEESEADSLRRIPETEKRIVAEEFAKAIVADNEQNATFNREKVLAEHPTVDELSFRDLSLVLHAAAKGQGQMNGEYVYAVARTYLDKIAAENQKKLG